MEKHVINSQEYGEVLIVNHLNLRKYNSNLEYLEELFAQCTYWEGKMIGPNQFLTKVLEQLHKADLNSEETLEWVYNLTNTHNFEINEGGFDFVQKTFKMGVLKNMTLEEKLVHIIQDTL